MPVNILTEAEREASLPVAAIAAHFVSLGSSCELGFVQRYLGAEPLDMLRWSHVHMPDLIRGLRADFAGLGDRLELTGGGAHEEWAARDMTYQIALHVGTYGRDMDRTKVEAEMRVRLRIQRTKLLSDIETGRKIMVRWREPLMPDDPIAEEEIAALLDALRWHGPAELMVVEPGAEPDVVRAGPGLLRATLWGLCGLHTQAGPDLAGWLKVMVRAVKLAQEAGH